MKKKNDEMYVRYNTSHKGRHGFEFLEFEINNEGRWRYANNSNYKSECLIRKEVYINPIVLKEIGEMINTSKILEQDDIKWPEAKEDSIGKQELEIIYMNQHISFCTAKIGSLYEISKSEDKKGLEIFYYLIQDIKCLVFSLINLHFRTKPIS